jgi:hypothetical protein
LVVVDVDAGGGAEGVEVGGADVGGDRLRVVRPDVEEVPEEGVRACGDELLWQAGGLGNG